MIDINMNFHQWSTNILQKNLETLQEQELFLRINNWLIIKHILLLEITLRMLIFDLTEMQLLSKYNKAVRFLLCSIDIYRNYAWDVE